MRNLTKALTVVSLLAPVSGYSLGIGDIRVRSALNQNLNAEIALVTSRGEKPSSIKVSLASAEKFDEAGVAWTYFLSKIRFNPVVKPNGSVVIKVTSREALKEPYLNFLLEVSWPKGSLYREFTVLVDPPAEYQQPAYQEQSYQESVYQEPVYPTSSRYEHYQPQKKIHAPRHRAVRHANRSTRSNEGGFGGQIVTRRNDTLWGVAERARGAGVSVEQMMMALYEKNPHAFYQQNVNALSAGKTLRIPEKSSVQQTSRQEALAEFSRHNAAWNNNRSSVASGETQSSQGEVVDSQLKLEAPAEASVGANETVASSSEQVENKTNKASQSASQQQVPQERENAKETSTAVDDALQSKVAALEKKMSMMQELIDVKDKQLAELQNPTQSELPAAPAEAVVPPQVKPEQPTPVAAASEPPVQTVSPTPTPTPILPVQPIAPVKPVVKQPVKKIVPPVRRTVAEEPSNPLVWILGGLGAILVPLFGWLWWQKKQMIKETDAESMFRNYSTMRTGESSGPLTTIAKKSGAAAVSAESSFLNDFKASDFESFESFNVEHGDIDPIAEADVYLAYGRYQQAEDLIRQAIKDTPDRDECKLKLLEIFHANTSKEEFENYAMELAKAGKREDKDFWRKVSELSKDICPDSDLFASSGSNNVAVFSTESEVLAESVLLGVPAAAGVELANRTPSDEEIENLGVATFEITDVDTEESHFDALHQGSEIKPVEEPKLEIADVASKNSEAAFERPFVEEKVGESNDIELLDFDLGPYPGATEKTEAEIPLLAESAVSGNDELKFEMDSLDDKGEFEAYEFDFNQDKVDANKAVKEHITSTNQTQDTWNPEKTIDFSVDTLAEVDTFGNDTIDFNFDMESSLTEGSDEKLSYNEHDFTVSDLTDMDEIETKLDLAKAYIDMGDVGSAQDIIKQVIEIGTAEQKKTAKALLDDLSLG